MAQAQGLARRRLGQGDPGRHPLAFGRPGGGLEGRCHVGQRGAGFHPARGRNQTPIFCLPSGVRWCRWRAGCRRGMRCHGDVESASVADGSQSRPLPAGSAAHARGKRFRAGTVFRNGPQAHGSRANRATTATPVTTRACRTSAANHGCLVSCASPWTGKGPAARRGLGFWT